VIDPYLFTFWLRWQLLRADRPVWWTWKRMLAMTVEEYRFR